jgi:hypothetical protein
MLKRGGLEGKVFFALLHSTPSLLSSIGNASLFLTHTLHSLSFLDVVVG